MDLIEHLYFNIYFSRSMFSKKFATNSKTIYVKSRRECTDFSGKKFTIFFEREKFYNILNMTPDFYHGN